MVCNFVLLLSISLPNIGGLLWLINHKLHSKTPFWINWKWRFIYNKVDKVLWVSNSNKIIRKHMFELFIEIIFDKYYQLFLRATCSYGATVSEWGCGGGTPPERGARCAVCLLLSACFIYFIPVVIYCRSWKIVCLCCSAIRSSITFFSGFFHFHLFIIRIFPFDSLNNWTGWLVASRFTINLPNEHRFVQRFGPCKLNGFVGLWKELLLGAF